MGFADSWVLIIFVVFCYQAQVLNSQNLTCNSIDLLALEGFLKGLESGFEDWRSTTTTNGSSSSSDCCGWTGITCDLLSKRVVSLELGGRRLKGNNNNLVQTLAGLDQLKTLNLSSNLFSGTLPYDLFRLQKLEFLDLSFNYFTGSFPAKIDLPSLEFLDVSQNYIAGPINTVICENSTRIRVLNVSMNYLNGSFPSGFGNCASLVYLHLNSNKISGSLPEDLFDLRKLVGLTLQDNMLSGPLSSRISNLTELEQLDISLNTFSGFLPDVFYNHNSLQRLSAHSNKFSGRIPISLSTSPTIQLLNLRNNSLSGKIDINCTAMVNLSSLDLGSNQFIGPLDDSLADCRQLRVVNLARNSLKGELPESFMKLQSLSYLSLSNTSLRNISSALRILQKCKNLTTVVLTTNFHSEEMPTDPDLHFENLRALVIANCGLTGKVPHWLRSSTKLQLVDLSWNHLSGTVPDWFGGMEFLFYLDMSNNSLSGEIPKSLTTIKSLINRNISFQEPFPDFPFFIKRNQSARGLQYNQIWSFPPSLDLSSNFLTGRIWPEFGNLKKLHCLDLNRNNLSGPIPSELSGMTSLETLDLSYNDLSGAIPTSLTNLSFLSKFNVANNHLDGKIPSGGQFSTFPASSFEGNKDLCGEHSIPCSRNLIPPRSPRTIRRSKGMIIGMVVGIMSGTILLLALMFVMITKSKSCRRDDLEPKVIDGSDKDLESPGSRSVILFQNKENSRELFIEDLLKSTNNFDQANIIGCGGFGLVYKATLPDGRKVAIKRLSGECGEVDREFQAEVESLSRAQHDNLVLLQGYCRCKADRLLIYSYMENGSLDFWLHEKLDGGASLDWETRLRIAQGAARGLAYLHQACEPHILHRDIKSSNILLDENFEAHLADFGLARLIHPYDTHVTTDLVGTLGYIPPEYGHASVATFKGDVYSFGVVLLELLTGKRPMDMCKPKGCRDLISWVLQMKKEKRETEVFDPFIYDKEHDKEMLWVLQIACLCLSESPKVRPTTQQIVTWLDCVDLNDQLTK